jgi:hypothetical protein
MHIPHSPHRLSVGTELEHWNKLESFSTAPAADHCEYLLLLCQFLGSTISRLCFPVLGERRIAQNQEERPPLNRKYALPPLSYLWFCKRHSVSPRATSKDAARSETKAAFDWIVSWLLSDAIRALACGVLRGVDFLAALAAEDAHEAADSVLLPARGFHDLGQGRTFRTLHQGDHFGLLVGPRFGCVLLSLGAPRRALST